MLCCGVGIGMVMGWTQQWTEVGTGVGPVADTGVDSHATWMVTEVDIGME